MADDEKKPGLDPLRNPLDPLHKVEPNGRDIFVQLYQVIEGRDRRQVFDAVTNLLCNVIRAMEPTQVKANGRVDQFAAATKHILDQHYTNAGTRRNIFPHHQHVHVPYLGRLDDIGKKH